MYAKFESIRASREQGFTLIELLVVILIIGILAAVAIPMFMNQRKGGVDATVESDVKNAATTVATWDAGTKSKPLPFPSSPSGTPLADIKVSDGGRLEFYGNSAEYCIIGKNSGGDKAVSGISYSSINGGLNKSSPCTSSFTPATHPTINGSFVIGAADPALASGAGSGAGGGAGAITPVTCDGVVFTPNVATVTVSCNLSATNWSQDIFAVTVSTTSATPVEWSVAVNAGRAKGYIKTDLDSPNAFDNYAVTQPTFTVVGTDRSGTGNPSNAVNYKTVKSGTNLTFNARVQWR